MAYFPLFIDLEGKKGLVVGGGRVAARKAGQLLSYGAELLVVAKEVSAEMRGLASGSLRLQTRPARVEDARGMDLVICASDDHRLHERMAAFCKERRIWIDVADDRAGSTFLFPGLVRQGDVVLGITTGGDSPAATRYLRRQIEGQIPPFFGALVERLGALREPIKESVPDPRERERLFAELLALGLEREGVLPDELVMERLDGQERWGKGGR